MPLVLLFRKPSGSVPAAPGHVAVMD